MYPVAFDKNVTLTTRKKETAFGLKKIYSTFLADAYYNLICKKIK